MRKLRTFFHVLFKSATDPGYYRDILKTRFSFSLQYLAFLLFLLSLVTTAKAVTLWRSAAPGILRFEKQLEEGGKSWYPKDLVVTVKDGLVSTNVKEPYVIDFPVPVPVSEDQTITHFITIDTKAQAVDFAKYQSAVMVGGNAIYYRDNNGYKFYPLTDMKGEFVVNKALYDEWMAKALPYIRNLPTAVNWLSGVAIVLLPFVLTFGALASKLTYLSFVSLVVLLLAKLMKKPVGYGAVYRLGMHGLTVPIFLSLVLGAFGVRVPLLFTAVFLVWMGVVLSRLATVKKHR